MNAHAEAMFRRLPFSASEIADRTEAIYSTVLAESKWIADGNFDVFHPYDLQLLFDEYDNTCFDGLYRQLLGDAPLRFRLSNRMTRAGGTTTMRKLRAAPQQRQFEIAVSSTLLFQTFNADDHRTIEVTGIACHNRLQALQRIFEHEMIHLLELLLCDASSCKAKQFQSLAFGFFGHTRHTHELITPKEVAYVKFGIQPGVRVRFEFEGRQHTGIVNRVTKRATVLVEDSGGALFSDGKRYQRYYVPLRALQAIESPQR